MGGGRGGRKADKPLIIVNHHHGASEGFEAESPESAVGKCRHSAERAAFDCAGERIQVCRTHARNQSQQKVPLPASAMPSSRDSASSHPTGFCFRAALRLRIVQAPPDASYFLNRRARNRRFAGRAGADAFEASSRAPQSPEVIDGHGLPHGHGASLPGWMAHKKLFGCLLEN
jgi:hypothetical protein